MQWIHDYQLFLFDFDGILVNTEEFHYRAYQLMCQARGVELKWSLDHYLKLALFSATALRDELMAEYPALGKEWDKLYEEKKQIYTQLIEKENVALMPGVDQLLTALKKHAIKRVVVTHSAREHIEKIKEKQPLLKTIPHWITREDYSKPKPDPECYQLAVKCYALPEDRIVGFEDSPRGLKALMGTRAEAHLVSEYFTHLDLGGNFHRIAHFGEKEPLSRDR